MGLDLQAFSEKLKKCFAQFNITNAFFNVKTGISEQRTEGLLSGKNEPTGDEILVIADFFKCDYKYFISNDKLAAFEQTESLYRKHGMLITKEDRWNIQEFLYLCECEEFLQLEMGKKRGQQIFSFEKRDNYYKGQGVAAAAVLRSQLGYMPNEPPMDIYEDYRKLGIHVFRRKLEQSSISGIYLKHPVAGKCVLINYDEDVFRQKFTAAHELGHALLDDEEFCVSVSEWGKPNLSEIRANLFASNFLLPGGFISEISHVIKENKQNIIKIAKGLKLNPEVILIALKNAGYISRYDIEKYKIKQSEKGDPELSFSLSPKMYLRKKELLEKGLSFEYVSLCIDAYEHDVITRSRLAEMLLINEQDLYELFNLFGRFQ